MSKFSHAAAADATATDAKAMTIPRCFLRNSRAKNLNLETLCSHLAHYSMRTLIRRHCAV